MKLQASLLTLASMTLMFVSVFESQLSLKSRLENGTIQADVVRVQTYLTSDGETKTVVYRLDQTKYERNMRAIRQHVNCVVAPDTLCKTLSPR